jgi:predicted transcriptional regulator
MTKINEIWDRTGQIVRAFSPFYQEDMIRLTQEYDSPNYWFMLNWVRASEPKPFRLEDHIDIVGPYSTREWVLDVFKQLTDDGFLEEKEIGELILTERGRGLIEGFFNTAHEALAHIEPLPAADMAMLETYLLRVVESSLEAPEPRIRPRLLNSRWTDPGDDAPPAVRIDQYVTDLYRFRDDTHIAAWKAYEVSGQLWETLSLIWREEANDASQIAKQLSYRGYDEEDYGKALAQLETKGWIKRVGDHFQITTEGKRIREEAEEKTDTLFFASWSVLDEDELDRLDELVRCASDNLKKMSDEKTWDLAMDVVRGLTPVTRSVVDSLFEEYFGEPRFFFPTLLATGSEPESYSTEDYIHRNPYTNPVRSKKVLSDISEAGFMKNGTGAYRVSEKGHEALFTVNDAFYRCLGELEVASNEDLELAVGFLEKLVDASLDAADPIDKIAIVNMHNTHPDAEYPWMAKIDMLMDDLRAFRDDAHVAAWRPHEVSGRTWETLSFVWQEEARTASDLVESLPFRGYGEEDYTKSLIELSERDWLKKGPDGYATTDKGKTIRLEAEETTNRIFFEPWSVLDDTEGTQFRGALIRMKIDLENLAEKEKEAVVS